jgi:hypothetical protein
MGAGLTVVGVSLLTAVLASFAQGPTAMPADGRLGLSTELPSMQAGAAQRVRVCPRTAEGTPVGTRRSPIRVTLDVTDGALLGPTDAAGACERNRESSDCLDALASTGQSAVSFRFGAEAGCETAWFFAPDAPGTVVFRARSGTLEQERRLEVKPDDGNGNAPVAAKDP